MMYVCFMHTSDPDDGSSLSVTEKEKKDFYSSSIRLGRGEVLVTDLKSSVAWPRA